MELQKTESIKEKINSNPQYKERLYREILALTSDQKINLNTLSRQKFGVDFDENNGQHLLDIYAHLYISKNGTSIYDYLRQKSVHSSFQDRKKLFQHISNEIYTGTPPQNMRLYRYLVHNYEIAHLFDGIAIGLDTQKNLSLLKEESSKEKPPKSAEFQKKFTPTDILNNISILEQDAQQKLPDDLKTFLQKYSMEAETYAQKKERHKQEEQGGLANVMSHNYASQFIASLVYSGLPNDMSTGEKVAISSLVAGSSLLGKEAFVDKKITVSDVSIPVFLDLGENNFMWITFTPNGNISTEFRFNNLKKLNEKAAEYIATTGINFTRINHGNEKQWTKSPIENILQASVGFKPYDLINIIDSIKNSENAEKNMALLQEFSEKYGLNIPSDDIRRLGPLSTLQTFAIVNKDLIGKQALIQLGIEFQGGKIILPKDLDISDPNIFLRMSIGGRLGMQIHSDRLGKNESTILTNDIFAQLNIGVSENLEIETMTGLSPLLGAIAKVGAKYEIQRDDTGMITSVIIEGGVIAKEIAVGLGIQKMDTSGQGSKLIFSLTGTGGCGVTYGNVSKVFGDTQTSTSLFLSKIIPAISSIEIKNPGTNVTFEGNTIGKLDHILQAIVTTPEAKAIGEKVKIQLLEISKNIGIDIDFLSEYLRNTENLKKLEIFLDENKSFIKENKEKIRYIVFVGHLFSQEDYSESSQVLTLNPLHGTEKLNQDIFKKRKNPSNKENDDHLKFYVLNKIEESDISLKRYIEGKKEMNEAQKNVLINTIESMQITGFDILSDGEKEGFIQVILRTLRLGQGEKLRNRRINIIGNTLLFPAIAQEGDKKTLTIERGVLKGLGNGEFNYSENNITEETWPDNGDKKKKIQALMSGLNKEEQEIIKSLIMDISRIEFVSNTDSKLIQKTNDSRNYTGNTDIHLPFYKEDGVLYISENVWRGGYGFEKIATMLKEVKDKNIQKFDTILGEFTSRKAQIVKLQRNSGSKQFYEFRPSSDIIQDESTSTVSYDIFDHGNKKIDAISVIMNKNLKAVDVIIGGNTFGLDELLGKKEYEHIILALTGMRGETAQGDTKAIGGIIAMMI